VRRRDARSTCFTGLAIICLVAAAGPSLCAQTSRPAARFNVLFIAIDDLNCHVGCYGYPFAKTPNIDRLARRGTRFERAYCQVALCNPSRTSLLSGRRPDVTRVYDNRTPPRTTLGPVVFLPEHFRTHGYFTARVGKIAHGAFEDAVAWNVAEDPSETIRENTLQEDEVARSNPTVANSPPVVTWHRSNAPDAEHVDGKTALRIVELLRQRRDKPFFIGVGFHKPHLPWIAPRRYFEMFPAQSVPLPQEPTDVRKQIPPLALITTRPDGAQLTEHLQREAIAAYTACTAFVDAQVGIVLRAIDELGLGNNTVIVLWGDHGWHLGDHGGLWGKLTVFEEAARVPLIVAAPGGTSGAVSPRLVELVDLYPTLVELCGVPASGGLEGTSLVSLLQAPNRPWKKAAFTQVLRDAEETRNASHAGAAHPVMGRSVRTERWRYTEWERPEVAELYDHDHDPHELRNLASAPEHRQTVAALRQMLTAGWREAEPEVRKAEPKRSAGHVHPTHE
jgi:iduronate 2-sulfatase